MKHRLASKEPTVLSSVVVVFMGQRGRVGMMRMDVCGGVGSGMCSIANSTSDGPTVDYPWDDYPMVGIPQDGLPQDGLPR